MTRDDDARIVGAKRYVEMVLSGQAVLGHVHEGFADHAQVRYTADARDWTRLAIGLMDDRKAFREGRLIKDGQGGSIAWYFYQPYQPERVDEGEAG